MSDVASLIDLSRYPLTEPDSPVLAARLATLRDSLQRTGAAEAPAFLTPDGLERCIADAQALAHRNTRASAPAPPTSSSPPRTGRPSILVQGALATASV